MVVQYFRIAWRTLRRQWQHSLINVAGLAIGMGCCILIMLYVVDEHSFDRFHEHAGRIYRIAVTETNNEGQQESKARTVRAVAYTLRQDLPEVAAAATLFQRRQSTMRCRNELFLENRVFETDSNVFKVFTIPFISGNPSDALRDPHALLLTESTARKYFGSEDPLGKIIESEDMNYTVTAVVKDVPHNAHFHFDMLVQMRTIEIEHNTTWQGSPNYLTYVRLTQNTSADAFTEKLRELKKKYNPESADEYFIQPLTEIHLHSDIKGELEPNGDADSLRIVTTIALFVIIIAGINYINLATARATKRAKEIGVRKTSGALRSMLIGQFMAESVLTALLAFALSILLVSLLLPAFNQLAGKTLEIFQADNTMMWFLLTSFALGIGLLAGFYPALLLSSFDPVKVLKGSIPSAPGSGAWIRQGLVGFQFAISIGLIIATIVIVQQMEFIQRKDPGFNRNQVILVSQARTLPNRLAIEQKMEQLAGVEFVGASTAVVGKATWTGNIRANHTQADRLIDFCQIDYEYLDAMGIPLLQGRNFSRDFPSDTVNTIILNETAVKMLNLKDPIGQQLVWDATALDTILYAEVVGVVRDFHYASFHEPIRPFAFLIRNNFFVQDDFTSSLAIRLHGNNSSETIQQIENIWKEFVPARPFTFTYMEDSYREWHASEERFEKIFGALTSLAIFIACLGLFALITFVVAQRTREISIRKVLGASASSVLFLINKDLAKLIAIAFVVASVCGFYMMGRWLDTFVYHINFSIWTFLAAGCIALLIMLITTGYQSFKASKANPIDSLKTE